MLTTPWRTWLAALVVGVMAAVGAMQSPSVASSPPAQVLTIQKVGPQGSLLPGGKFTGYSCTRWDNDIDWQCQDLNDYAWFNNTDVPAPGDPPVTWGLSRTGSTMTSFTDDIPMRGGWALPIQHCLILKEKSAPQGYESSTAPALVCMGPGGWTVANATGVEISAPTYDNPNTPEDETATAVTYTAGLGGWTVTNTEKATPDGPLLETIISLKNLKPTVTFQKVTPEGTLLPGATIRGFTCSRFDGDPSWTCVSLDAEPWFSGALSQTGRADQYLEQIYTQGGWAAPIIQCLGVYEAAPPTGYLARTAPAMVCKGPGGWTVQNTYGPDGQKDPAGDPTPDDIVITPVEGGPAFSGGLGDWKVTNDPATLATVFTLVNPRPAAVPLAARPAIVDACNPAGTTSNVDWADPVPAATALVSWTQDGSKARTATLVDPVATRWSNGTTSPLVFTLPADAGTQCTTRGIPANTGR